MRRLRLNSPYFVSLQIGDGTANDQWTPVNVTSLGGGVQSIALGGVRVFDDVPLLL